MNPLLNFINKTIKGGIFFLIPVALIFIIGSKIFHLLKPLAQRFSHIIDRDNKFIFDLTYLIISLFLIFVCFGFGLLASLREGKLFIKWLEDNVLVIIPGYAFMKSTGQAIVGMEEATNYPVVFVNTGGWAIAFLIEKIDDDAVLFVPGSPNPLSGRVLIFKQSALRETSMTQVEALRYLRHTGVGLKDMKLKDIDQSKYL